MGDKQSTFANDALLAIFNAVFTNLGAVLRDAASPTTNLYVALHTAAPAGTDPTSNEATYTGYARQAVVRTSSGWTVSGGTVTNAAAIAFGLCTAGSNTITHWSISTGTGASKILYFKALSASLAVSAGITPRFEIGDLSGAET